MRKILTLFQGGHLQHSGCPGNNFITGKQTFIGGDDLGLFPEHLGQKFLSCVVVVST